MDSWGLTDFVTTTGKLDTAAWNPAVSAWDTVRTVVAETDPVDEGVLEQEMLVGVEEEEEEQEQEEREVLTFLFLFTVADFGKGPE